VKSALEFDGRVYGEYFKSYLKGIEKILYSNASISQAFIKRLDSLNKEGL
jgi:hypothetical protein